jgi:hypothetical protein
MRGESITKHQPTYHYLYLFCWIRSKFGKSTKLNFFAQYAYPSRALVVDRIAWSRCSVRRLCRSLLLGDATACALGIHELRQHAAIILLSRRQRELHALLNRIRMELLNI